MDKICSYLGNYKKIIDLDDKKPADNIALSFFFSLEYPSLSLI